MADSSVTDLPNSLTPSTIAEDDLFLIDDISDAESKKITLEDLRDSLVERVEFETSKDLVFNVDNNTQATATCSRMSLLDSNFIPKYIVLDDTWDMGSHLEAGTSEKPSTWYGAWIDSDKNKVLAPDLEGVADSFTAGELRDSTATWLTDLIHAGDIVYNLDSKLKTKVTLDATVQGIVILDDNIFPLGSENYKIVKMSPVGLGESRERIGAVYNNSSGHLDDSTYTQIQEKGFYTEAAGDFTVALTGGGGSLSAVNFAYIIPYQTKDSSWRAIGNISVLMTSVSRANATITISGITFHPDGEQSISGGGPGTTQNTAAYSFAVASTGNLKITHVTGVTAEYRFSFDVQLDKKPTFHN